jgi:hypothetical protein
MNLIVSESPKQMSVMDVGTRLNIDLMQEIGIGVLYIKEPIDSGNVTKR